jgi:hypothetical protein
MRQREKSPLQNLVWKAATSKADPKQKQDWLLKSEVCAGWVSPSSRSLWGGGLCSLANPFVPLTQALTMRRFCRGSERSRSSVARAHLGSLVAAQAEVILGFDPGTHHAPLLPRQ